MFHDQVILVLCVKKDEGRAFKIVRCEGYKMILSKPIIDLKWDIQCGDFVKKEEFVY